ncbi:MAG: glycosyltransferase family 4 protein [Anaerolineae bacterium]|nr:glycosyltransferase family 4 protein [Gloeobacterales cyanobacterium ES-bin-313]
MKTRVALLRGANLNDPELASYQPLLDRFSFSFFCNARGALPIRSANIKAQPLWYGDDFIRLLPSKLRNRARLTALRLFGAFDSPLRMSAICQNHDILHTAETFSGYSLKAVELKRQFNHKVILTVWENIPFLYENIPTTPFGRKLAQAKAIVRQSADHFLVASQTARMALELEGVEPERITYIGTAVSLENFQPRPKTYQLHRKLNIAPDSTIILFAGRLVWEKGVFDLLEAFTLLHRSSQLEKDVHLLYNGNPYERDRLMFECRRLGLQERVHFLEGKAYANANQMPGLYNDVDVLVLPSLPTRFWMEQFGIVLIEAMASGIPVLGSSSGAIPEVIGDAGVVFPAHDIQALASALSRLLKSPQMRQQLAERGRQRCETFFSPQSVSNRISGAYDRVMCGQISN